MPKTELKDGKIVDGEGKELDAKALHELIVKAEADLGSVVGELQVTRKAKSDAEDKVKELTDKVTPPEPAKPETADVASEVKKALDEQARQDSIKQHKAAEDLFKNTHKEFHPDNDPGGIKYAAFQAKMARINTTGLASKEDFLEAFEDALIIMKRGTDHTQTRTSSSQYASTSSNTSTGPRSVDNSGLSEKEQTLIKSQGWTEERYLALKKTQGPFLEKLLESVK